MATTDFSKQLTEKTVYGKSKSMPKPKMTSKKKGTCAGCPSPQRCAARGVCRKKGG